MPHDVNGDLLQAGDTVLIEAKVVQVTTGEDYCNVTLETVLPMPPHLHGTSIVLNTRQVRKVND